MAFVSLRIWMSKEAWLDNETNCGQQRKFDQSASEESCKRHWQQSMIQSTEDPIQWDPIYRIFSESWKFAIDWDMKWETGGKMNDEWKGRSDDSTTMMFMQHDSGQVLFNLQRHIQHSWLRHWWIQVDTGWYFWRILCGFKMAETRLFKDQQTHHTWQILSDTAWEKAR